MILLTRNGTFLIRIFRQISDYAWKYCSSRQMCLGLYSAVKGGEQASRGHLGVRVEVRGQHLAGCPLTLTLSPM